MKVRWEAQGTRKWVRADLNTGAMKTNISFQTLYRYVLDDVYEHPTLETDVREVQKLYQLHRRRWVGLQTFVLSLQREWNKTLVTSGHSVNENRREHWLLEVWHEAETQKRASSVQLPINESIQTLESNCSVLGCHAWKYEGHKALRLEFQNWGNTGILWISDKLLLFTRRNVPLVYRTQSQACWLLLMSRVICRLYEVM